MHTSSGVEVSPGRIVPFYFIKNDNLQREAPHDLDSLLEGKDDAAPRDDELLIADVTFSKSTTAPPLCMHALVRAWSHTRLKKDFPMQEGYMQSTC